MKQDTRLVVSSFNCDHILEIISKELEKKVMEKGPLSFSSSHECLGVITEEYYELIEAIKNNDDVDVISELKDVIISAIWGLTSYHASLIDGNKDKTTISKLESSYFGHTTDD